MTGFDFAVDDSTSTDTTTTEDTEETPDFQSNEVAEIYISAGDWKRTLGKCGMLYQIPVPEGAKYTTEVGEGDDKRTVLKELKIQSDDNLEDVSRLLGKYQDAHPQQKLHMVASLLKSTAGKMQTGKMERIKGNDHAIGLRDGKAPDEHPEGRVSYALYHSDLPSINWDDLDGGERESLEEMGIDVSDLGFDTEHLGPKLMVIDGQRLPIAVEEGDEVMEALDLLQQLPNEPSGYTEDGFRESSDPSVFGDVDTDKVAEKSSSDEDNNDDEDVFNLAANPERVNEVTVSDLRGQGPEELSVTNITNLRAIQTMLRVESDAENTRKGAMTRLKERRNALQNGEDDEADTETDEGASDDNVAESVEDVEDEAKPLSDADKQLMSALLANQNNDINTKEEAIAEVQSI